MINVSVLNNSPYPFAIPVIDKSLKQSAKMLPDLHLIGVPYYASIALGYAIYKSGMYSTLKYKRIVTENNIPSKVAEFVSKYIENYSYLVAYSQYCLEEYERRFGYMSKLIDVIDWYEYNEPAMESWEDFEKERTYIGLKKHKYIELEAVNINDCVESWSAWLKENHSFTLDYINSDKPKIFNSVRLTEDNKEQNKACIEQLTRKINQTI